MMSLRDKALGGIKWMSLSTIINVVFQSAQLIVLARVLDPDSIGLMGIVMIIIALSDLFMDLGLSSAIVQRKEITKKELASLYWFNFITGWTIAGLLYLSSDLIGLFFNQEQLAYYIQYVSILFLIVPFGQQYRAIMQKELQFNTIAQAECISTVFGVVLAITLALLGFDLTSILLGQIATALIRTVMLFIAGSKLYRPMWHFHFAEVKSFLSFGIYHSGESLLNYLNTNIDTLSIGKLLGSAALGFYNIAFSVIIIPSTKLNPMLTRVMFPLLSKMQDDEDRLKNNFYKLLSLVNLVNIPLFVGLFVTSSVFIEVVFGAKWASSVVLLQILCGVGLLRSVASPIGSLLMATGKVRLNFKFNVVRIFIQVPVIILSAYLYGTIGVAVAFLILQVAYMYLSFFFLIKNTINTTFKEFFKTMIGPLRLSLIMACSVFCVQILSSSLVPLFSFILQVASGGITYLLLLLISNDQYIKEYRMFLRSNVKPAVR